MRITIGNGSRVETISRQMVSDSANWIIIINYVFRYISYIKFLIQQWKRTNVRVEQILCCRLTMRTLITTSRLENTTLDNRWRAFVIYRVHAANCFVSRQSALLHDTMPLM